MSQVNLLPPEIQLRQRTKKITLGVIAGGVGLVLLIVFYYLLQANNLGNVRHSIDAVEGQNAGLQTEIAGLQEFAQLQLTAQAKDLVVTQVYANEISFSGLLLDMSIVIPSDAYLSSLSVSVTGLAASTGDTTINADQIGAITFAGQGLGTDAVASIVTSFDRVEGWVNTFVNGFSRQQDSDVEDYTGSVDLTSDLLTKRGKRGAEATAGVLI